MWVRSLGWEDPLEEEMATHSSILAWEISWTEESGGVTKRHTWLNTRTHGMRLEVKSYQYNRSDFPFKTASLKNTQTILIWFTAMWSDATHSSVLAWRIPGTGEPSGLPSMGSHRTGHDWSDLAAAAAEWCLPPVHLILSPCLNGCTDGRGVHQGSELRRVKEGPHQTEAAERASWPWAQVCSQPVVLWPQSWKAQVWASALSQTGCRNWMQQLSRVAFSWASVSSQGKQGLKRMSPEVPFQAVSLRFLCRFCTVGEPAQSRVLLTQHCGSLCCQLTCAPQLILKTRENNKPLFFLLTLQTAEVV